MGENEALSICDWCQLVPISGAGRTCSRSCQTRLWRFERQQTPPVPGLVLHERTGRWVDPEFGLVYSNLTKKPVKTLPKSDGYVAIWGADRAHRIIWEAVNGPIPDGLVINHINAIRHDNRISNLEAVTQGQNVQHTANIGRHARTRIRAKLTVEQVRTIKRQLASGVEIDTLSEQYYVSWQAIYYIKVGKTWRGIS